MRRRDLLTSAVAAAVLAPFGAAAQPGLPIIGYFSDRSAEAETPLRTGFIEGLQEAGFVVGRNVAIAYRFTDGQPDLLPSLVDELIGLPAALLVATSLGEALAAKNATTTIPIVFSVASNPVQRSLVASFNRPGSNATGVYIFGVSAIPKRLELLREILPQPGLIAFLVSPQLQMPPPQVREFEAAAEAVGQPILVLYGRDEDEIEKEFATMAERQVRGLLFGQSNYFQIIADKLIALAARYRIPASYDWREFCRRWWLDELQREPSRNDAARR